MALVDARFWIRAVVDTGLPLKDVLREVIEEVRRLVEAESCSVVLLDVPQNELVFYATGGTSGQGRPLDEYRFPAEKGITGWVVQHGESALVNDPFSDARFYDAVSKDVGLPTRNIMVAPLRFFGRTIGAIAMLNKSGGFADSDLKVLEDFAYHAGYEIGRCEHLTVGLPVEAGKAVE